MEDASFHASMEVANTSLVGVTDSSGSHSSTFTTRSYPVRNDVSQPAQPAVSKWVFLSFLSAQTLSLCCDFPSALQLKCLCACLTPTVCHTMITTCGLTPRASGSMLTTSLFCPWAHASPGLFPSVFSIKSTPACLSAGLLRTYTSPVDEMSCSKYWKSYEALDTQRN